MDVEQAGWSDRLEGAGCMVGVHYIDGVTTPHNLSSVCLVVYVLYVYVYS